MAEPVLPRVATLPERRRPWDWGALGGWACAALAWLTRPARLLPGLAAVGCAVAGTWLLWGLGWGLLVAAAFLLALDLRIPRA